MINEVNKQIQIKHLATAGNPLVVKASRRRPRNIAHPVGVPF